MGERHVSRRTVMRAAGGFAGLGALPGLAVGREGAESGATTQEPLDKRIGMLATETGQTFFTVPIRWVEPGTTVVWQLVQGGHSTTAYAAANGKPQRIPAGASAWDSGVLTEPGTTFEQTFTVPGVYDYYCSPHESLGMVGRLVVGSPDLSAEPAMAEPQAELPGTVREALSALNVLTRITFG